MAFDSDTRSGINSIVAAGRFVVHPRSPTVLILSRFSASPSYSLLEFFATLRYVHSRCSSDMHSYMWIAQTIVWQPLQTGRQRLQPFPKPDGGRPLPCNRFETLL